jgi:D-alanine-D-alanine ligase-like ATP-grasp enzyme
MNIEEFVQAHVATRTPRAYRKQAMSQSVFYQQAAHLLGIKTRKNPPRTMFYFDNKVIGQLNRLRPDTVSGQAVSFCRNKQQVKDFLTTHHFAVPDGRTFRARSYSAALEYFGQLPGAKVFKPVDGCAGEGVTVGIHRAADFAAAFEKAATASSSGFVLIEREVSGVDVRTIVVDGQAVCSCVRVPAFVIGDGVTSIKDLITAKNILRKHHPHHGKFLLCDDEATKQSLREQALCLTNTPAKGHIVFLSKLGNVHLGAEAVDVTELVPREVIEITEAISRAINGLGVGAIDYRITSFSENANVCTLEINTSPHFGIHVMPMYGNSINPATAVLMHMMRRSFA